MKVKIVNSGEGGTTIFKKITKKQFEFLKEVSRELNNNKDAESYSPTLFVQDMEDVQ